MADIQIGWVDALCFGPIILSSLWALFGQPVAPYLINSHPIAYELVRGTAPALIDGGAFARVGRVPLWQAVLAPLPILMWVDPFYYWAGTRYGRSIIDHYKRQGPRMARRIERTERAFARYGAWAILIGTFVGLLAPFLFLAAGETRMKVWKVALADLGGNLLGVGLVVSIGWFAGQRGVDVAQAIGHYALIGTLVIVAVVVVSVVRQTRAQMRAAGRAEDESEA